MRLFKKLSYPVVKVP